MRLIDADELKNLPFERMIHTDFGETAIPIEEIDNVPTVDFVINIKDLTAEEKQHFFNVWRNSSFEIINDRPQGQWKVDGCLIACNKCGQILLKASKLYNYCPNCGAQMKTRTDAD